MTHTHTQRDVKIKSEKRLCVGISTTVFFFTFVLMGEVDGNGHIFQVSVRAGSQRRGVGRFLIAKGEQWAGQQGHSAVTLTTFRDLPWNAPAYLRLGYGFMDAGMAGPMLTDILENERALGLFRQVRVAMIKQV